MNNTTYYAADLMVYFEKHRFLEVIKSLLIRLAIDRPHCLKYYIRNNLRKIASTVWTNTIIVHLPIVTDVQKLAESIEKIIEIPAIIFNPKQGNKKLLNNLINFGKLSRKHGTSNRILLNFPRNPKDILKLDYCRIYPTMLINITGNDTNTNKHLNEVLDFYKNVTLRVSPSNINCTDTLAAQILYNIKFSPIFLTRELKFNYVYRIVMIGRRGSGRHTQAKLLAKRYNCVIVNAEALIDHTLQSKDNMAKVLCVSYKRHKEFSSSAITAIVWKRLLEPDALARGWILINFPKCLNEFEILMNKFQTPPNRFVVLHCTKHVALKRLVRQWEASFIEHKTKNTITHVEEEFAHYDKYIKDVYFYLKYFKVNTIHVDARDGLNVVKNKVFALLER